MENILKKIGKISSFASRYIGIIIIAFSCLAFFWRDGFAWMTNYTSVFLGVIMFGMGLTIRLEDLPGNFFQTKGSDHWRSCTVYDHASRSLGIV